MGVIVLDESQERLLLESHGKVELRGPSGNHLGYVSHGFTEEDIREALRRAGSDEPCHTTAEVLEHLRSLEPA